MKSAHDSKRILIAGATGFVGTALTHHLQRSGHEVIALVRSAPNSPNQVRWDPSSHQIDDALIDSADSVVNLAGASIAGGWWTASRKDAILRSRVAATETLAEAIARSNNKPDVFVSTSAVGYYGDRPGEVLDEASTRGEGFLPTVCEAWEAAALPASSAGVRVVHPRFGLVLSGSGGMLPLISLPFKMGVGGRIGGDQFMSWIDLHDLTRVIAYAIENPALEGPVNAVSPNPISNAEFTKAMGAALHRPTVLPIPARVAGMLGGQLVRELLLADQRVLPTELQKHGFAFDRPTIKDALVAARAVNAKGE